MFSSRKREEIEFLSIHQNAVGRLNWRPKKLIASHQVKKTFLKSSSFFPYISLPSFHTICLSLSLSLSPLSWEKKKEKLKLVSRGQFQAAERRTARLNFKGTKGERENLTREKEREREKREREKRESKEQNTLAAALTKAPFFLLSPSTSTTREEKKKISEMGETLTTSTRDVLPCVIRKKEKEESQFQTSELDSVLYAYTREWVPNSVVFLYLC